MCMSKSGIIGTIIGVALVAFLVVGSVNGWFTYAMNKVDYTNQKVNENTNYKVLKKVEDTCRSMMSSYNSDKLVYEQYKDADSNEKKSWAEQAKMRANKTASSYNNYMLKNSYVWQNNIPADIKQQLNYIE